MKKILFTHSYFLRFDPKQWETGMPYAPLGTLYAAALMRENGYTVSFFDTMFSQSPDEIQPSLEKLKPDIFVIYDDGFNYPGHSFVGILFGLTIRLCTFSISLMHKAMSLITPR